MIGTSLVVAALGIGAGSTHTTTDPHPSGERTLHLFSVKQAGVEYWKTRYWSMKKYARKQEIEKGHVLQLVTALRRKLYPPAPKTGVPSWFYRAIMCIHSRESSDWRYGAPGHGSNGFEGGLQFLNSTWLSSGGGRFAQHAYDASPSEQITVGYWLYKRSGFGPWPRTARACGVL